MRNRRELAIVVGILALAFALRIGGIAFGLDLDDPGLTLGPLPDERGMVVDVRDGFLSGSLDPGSFLNRGPAGFLLFGVVDAALIGARVVLEPGGWEARINELRHNPAWLHLVHRLVSLAAGVGSVWLLMRLVGSAIDRASGVCAGLFLAASYVHVRLSHFGTVDVVWGLTVLLALERMLHWIRDPSPRRAVVSGLCAGISAAFKYFSVLLGAHLLLAAFLARERAGPEAARRALWLAFLAMPAGFLLAYPGLFHSLDDLVRIVDNATNTLGSPLTVIAVLENAHYHFLYSLGVGLGEPVMVLGLAGVALAWKRGIGGRFLVLSLVLLLPTLFLTRVHAVRYGVPVLVLLAGCAGVAGAALLARAPRFLRPVLLALVVAPAVVRSAWFDHLILQTDTRVEMLAELARRDLPAEEVLAIGWHHGLPRPAGGGKSPFVVYGRRMHATARKAPETLRERAPRLILLDLSVSRMELEDLPEIETLLRDRYREVLRLDGRRGPVILPDPLGQPGLMLPYTRPWSVSRPGPPLVLYERVGEAPGAPPPAESR